MYDAYVIEVRDTTAGIVVRDGNRFLFCASDSQFFALEGHRFSNPRDAEAAARRHIDVRKHSRGGERQGRIV